MGGIGKALKGFFFEQNEEDEEDDLDVLDAPEPKVMTKGTQSVVETTPVASAPTPELKINKDIVDSIKKALEENKLKGYNYYEFMSAVEQQNEIASEQKKFQIVFSVVKGMGVTKDQLVSTADHYLKIVEKHKIEFDAKVASEEEAKVTRVRTEADNIEAGITAKTEQIEKLKQEIEVLHKKKVEALNVAQTNDVDLLQIKQDGNVAYKLFADQIKDGKNKIIQYIS
jgi:hypothetical protein